MSSSPSSAQPVIVALSESQRPTETNRSDGSEKDRMEGGILKRIRFARIAAGLAQGEFLASSVIKMFTDEDRLPHYKLFAMRWQVEG